MDVRLFREKWLPDFINDFDSLNADQKEETIQKLLTILGSREKFLLQTNLPNLLFRDLVKTLPTEIIEKILLGLSVDDLLKCCVTCKSWNKYFSSLARCWRSHGIKLGLMPRHLTEKDDWKKATVFVKRLRNQIKQGICFTHHAQEKLVGLDTHLSSVDHDKGIVVGATSDPASRNMPNVQEQLIFYDTKLNEVCLTISVRSGISLVKVKWPSHVVCGHFDGTLSSWNVEDGTSILLRGHTADVFTLDICESLDLIASGAADQTAKLWSLKTGILRKTLTDFDHWVVHVVLLSKEKHQIEAFRGQHVLVAMTKTFISLISWEDLNEWTEERWHFRIAVHDGDCLKTNLFTPGLHVYGQNIAFVRQVAVFDTQTVGDGELVIANANDGQVVTTVHINQKVRKLLAVGERFALLLLPFINTKYHNLAVVDLREKRVIGGTYVPHSRASNPGFTQIATGCGKWLDGFQACPNGDLIVALATADCTLHFVKWSISLQT